MTTVKTVQNEDDVRLLAMCIVDELLEQGMIAINPNADESTELAYQEVIGEAIIKKFKLNIKLGYDN